MFSFSVFADKLQDCYSAYFTDHVLAKNICTELLNDKNFTLSLDERSRIYVSLASIAIAEGDFKLSEHYLDTTFGENPNLLEPNVFRWNWLRTKAISLFKRDQYKLALDHFKETLEIAKKLESDSKLGTNHNDIASTYMELGQYLKAMENYKVSLAIYTKLKRPYSIAISLTGIGITYRDLGQFDTSIEFLQRAINNLESFLYSSPENDFGRVNLIGSRIELARTLIEAGKLESALSELNNVINEIEDKLDIYPQEYVSVLTAMSRVHRLRNQTLDALRQANLARQFELSNNLHPSLGLREQLAHALFDSGQYENARSEALIGLQESSRHFRTELNFLKLLAEVAEKLDEPEVSLNYYAHYIKQYEHYLNEKYNPRITDLKSLIEVQQQRQDIKILHTKQSLIEKQLQQRNIFIVVTTMFCVVLVLLLFIVKGQKNRQRIALQREIRMHKLDLERTNECETDDSIRDEDFVIENESVDNIQHIFNIKVVELMCLSCDFWEQTTGKDKIELAEKSKIWLVLIDDGRLRTRTMDKYLQINKLPKKPRWRQVIRTARFVLVECSLSNKQRDALNSALEQTLEIQRKIAIQK